MRRVILALMILLTGEVVAQQDLMLTQQIYSRVNINPAATGNTADVDLFLLGRLQWMGVDHAPVTTLLNATNYIPKIRSGIGFTFSYDRLGIGHNNTEARASYSFQIDLGTKWLLAMGASAGIFIGTYNPMANTLIDETERTEIDLPKEKVTKVTPDFNVGLEVNSMQWTFGFSCTHLANSESTAWSSDRHFYGYVVRAFEFTPQWDMLINAAYMNRNKTHKVELGTILFYDRLIWGGISWRPDLIHGCNPSYLSIMAGIEYAFFRVGYVYECGLGSNNTLPSNTHEILLSFKIKKKSN